MTDTVVGWTLVALALLWLAEFVVVDIAYHRWQRNHPPQVTELGRLFEQVRQDEITGRKS